MEEDAPPWTRAEPSRKLVSVGLRVTRGVTTHGAALNLSTETDYFQVFQPCGFAGSVMSTLKNLTPTAPSVAEAAFQLGPRLIEKWGKRARPGENWPPEHEGTAREAEGSERDTRN